jgi:WD40 repeat protein
MPSLYAMEKTSSRVITRLKSNVTKNASLLHCIKTVTPGQDVYWAGYGGNNNNIVALDKKGCYCVDVVKGDINKISDFGFNKKYGEHSFYSKCVVHPNGQKIIIAKDNSIEIRDINTGNQEWLKTEEYSIISVRFDAKNDMFLSLKFTQDQSFLARYSCKNIQTSYWMPFSSKIHLAVHPKRTIMSVIQKTDNKGGRCDSISLYDLCNDLCNGQNLPQRAMCFRKLQDMPCQMNEDGFLVWVNNLGKSFSVFNVNELDDLGSSNYNSNILKNNNDVYRVENEQVCNTSFYPTTSILLTISEEDVSDLFLDELSENESETSFSDKVVYLEQAKKIIRYWNLKTKKCISAALIIYGIVSSISFAPHGKDVAITSYGQGCKIYQVPFEVAREHAKNDFLYRLFLLNEYCSKVAENCKLLIPKDVRKTIANICL